MLSFLTKKDPVEETSEALNNLVIEPWYEECKNATYPWRATEALKKIWFSKMEDKRSSIYERFATAIGLARSSRLSDEERIAMEVFFALEQPYNPLPDSLLAEILLGGATPPEGWLTAYLESSFSANLPAPEAVISLALSLRHPYLNNEEVHQQPLDFFAGSQAPPRPPWRENPSSWYNGSYALFSPQGPEQTDTILIEIARLLRIDHTSESISRASIINNLPSDALFICNNHPCFKKGPASNYDALDPSRDALDFFCTSDEITSIWRYHNPLLIDPWLIDTVIPEGDPGILCALGLVGAPVALYRAPITRPCSADIDTLLGTHPSQAFINGYKGFVSRSSTRK